MKPYFFLVVASLACFAFEVVPDFIHEPTSVVSSNSVFSDEEDLVYEVSWTFFKLGTIHIKTLGNLKAIAYIDSYEGLPFVDLHSVHYTEMDSSGYSLGGYAIDKEEREWKGLKYHPDSSARIVAVERITGKDPVSPTHKQEPNDTIRLRSGVFLDGLSIAFFPRPLIHSVQNTSITTILKGKVGTTTFYFTNNKTTEKIGVIDDPVRAVQVEGTIDAVGLFGMTGDFTGWFSDDDSAVPIKGKLKVLLGSVTIELIHWNRKGWSPPQ